MTAKPPVCTAAFAMNRTVFISMADHIVILLLTGALTKHNDFFRCCLSRNASGGCGIDYNQIMICRTGRKCLTVFQQNLCIRTNI